MHSVLDETHKSVMHMRSCTKIACEKMRGGIHIIWTTRSTVVYIEAVDLSVGVVEITIAIVQRFVMAMVTKEVHCH